MIKLLAIDLDGTALDHQRKLVPSVIPAVQRAKEAGIQVILASGRILPSMKTFLDPLGLQGPVICSNGALLYGSDFELSHHWPVDKEAVRRLIEFAEHDQIHVNLYSLAQLYNFAESDWGRVYQQRVHSVPVQMIERSAADQLAVSKAMLVAEGSLIDAIQEKLADVLEGLPVRLTRSEPEYLECLNVEASKGHALETLATQLGLVREEVAAIGDYWNDIEMLQFAGTSAAVGNAAEETKRAAQVVVSSNEQGGVAEFVDSILRNRGQ